MMKTLMIGLGTLMLVALTRPALAQRCLSFRPPNPEMRRKYNFGAGVESDWTPGSRYQGVSPLAPAAIWEGENLEVDPPRRLVQSFRALWSEDVKREGTSRVTWEIEPVGDSELGVSLPPDRSSARDVHVPPERRSPRRQA